MCGPNHWIHKWSFADPNLRILNSNTSYHLTDVITFIKEHPKNVKSVQSATGSPVASGNHNEPELDKQSGSMQANGDM